MRTVGMAVVILLVCAASALGAQAPPAAFELMRVSGASAALTGTAFGVLQILIVDEADGALRLHVGGRPALEWRRRG